MISRACCALLICPRFSGQSFWNFTAACEVYGARSPAAPLGLITVAALLPDSWQCRLINRNTEELTQADLDWADLVMTGGMLPQRPDTQVVITLAQRHGKPVVVGGPDATSSPEAYSSADFQVLGEAEGVIDAWEAGARQGRFEADKFIIDVTKTPIPRYDLLHRNQERVETPMQVYVRDNDVNAAIRVLKKKMQREGTFREMKRRRSYEKPSERRVREKAEAVRRYRKALRKRLEREGY